MKTPEMENVSAQYVADSFVKQYYAVLNKCPENAHKFYKELSLLSWPGPDGGVVPVTTSRGINDNIVSSNYTEWFVETVDAQDSLEGGFMVAVTGFLTGKDNARNKFFQTFILAKQDNGFFVLNDILHIFENCMNNQASAPLTQNSVENGSVGAYASDHTASSETKDAEENGNIDSAEEMDQLASSNTENAVENKNLKEVIDLSVPNDTAATVTADPQENSILIHEPASDSKDNLAPANTEDTVKNGNVGKEVDSSVSKDTSATVAFQKITYASVVTKGRAGTYPETAKIPSNAYNRALSPPPFKVSATPSNTNNQAVAPQTANVPVPVVAGATNTTGHAEGASTGIYIGRLPIDIDKQGILKVVTKFGPVRKNLEGIQIRRHEDGFCCGFVEFESADSARRAVEVRHVNFGEKESYISYKKSSYQVNNGIRRSPSTGGFQSRRSKTRENGQASGNKRF